MANNQVALLIACLDDLEAQLTAQGLNAVNPPLPPGPATALKPPKVTTPTPFSGSQNDSRPSAGYASA